MKYSILLLAFATASTPCFAGDVTNNKLSISSASQMGIVLEMRESGSAENSMCKISIKIDQKSAIAERIFGCQLVYDDQEKAIIAPIDSIKDGELIPDIYISKNAINFASITIRTTTNTTVEVDYCISLSELLQNSDNHTPARLHQP